MVRYEVGAGSEHIVDSVVARTALIAAIRGFKGAPRKTSLAGETTEEGGTVGADPVVALPVTATVEDVGVVVELVGTDIITEVVIVLVGLDAITDTSGLITKPGGDTSVTGLSSGGGGVPEEGELGEDSTSAWRRKREFDKELVELTPR